MDAPETVCASLDGCAAYACGLEFGQLLARMRKGKPIADYFMRQNQDQILQVASRLDWTVLETRSEGDRIWIKMNKRVPQRQRRRSAVTAG